MLKKLSLLVAIVMLVSLLVPALSAVADDAEEANFVRFTALGNDPYATFKFSAAGKNATIDPDKVVWAAIRYRTISQFDTTGVEYKAQFYVSPAAEPYVPITYKHTQKWETAIVDLTAVAESTDLDSKWNSDSYTTLTSVRFDPLEPDRDSENTEHDGESGQVAEGDAIDVAWIAFFEKEDDAKAYTGKEDTPYCILDIDSLGGIAGGTRLEPCRNSRITGNTHLEPCRNGDLDTGCVGNRCEHGFRNTVYSAEFGRICRGFLRPGYL